MDELQNKYGIDYKFTRNEKMEWGFNFDKKPDRQRQRGESYQNQEHQKDSTGTTGEIQGAGRKKHVLVVRGKKNTSPQFRWDLGKRSITLRRVTDKISELAAGTGLVFIPNEGTTEAEKEKAEEVLKFADYDFVKCAMNGLVYERMAPVILTRQDGSVDSILQSENGEDVEPVLIGLNCRPAREVRFEILKMDSTAKKYPPILHFHSDWGFGRDLPQDCCSRDESSGVTVPNTMPLKTYRRKLNRGKITDEAFWVYSEKELEVINRSFQSYSGDVIKMSEGIFDNIYPIPVWAANSSINDIKNEESASKVRRDYMENGMHITAIINCWARSYNDSQGSKTAYDQQVNHRKTIEDIKGSASSGKVIVNYLGTEDPEKDGMIEVKEIDLQFSAESYRGIVEQSFISIMIALGINPRLFSIPDFNKSSGISSNGKELEVAIANLETKLEAYRIPLEKWILDKAIQYGFLEDETKGRYKVKSLDSTMKAAIASDIADRFMGFNEVREKILGVPAMTADQFKEYLDELAKIQNPANEEV